MIRITRTLPVPGQPGYTIEPDTPELHTALDAMRSWWPISELATFAELRHGYGNSDGGFGVIYPADRDDDESSAASLVEGQLLVYAFFGPPDGYEYVIPEAIYLECVAAYLRANDRLAEAARVEAFARK